MSTILESMTTQQDSTKRQYRMLYDRLQRMASAANGTLGTEASPRQVAEVFLKREGDWAQSTARLYRASLAFVFRETGSIASSEALRLIYRCGEDPECLEKFREEIRAERKKRRRTRPKTSAKKSKSISDKDLHLLKERLENSLSKYARSTLLWFSAGIITGLRPSEWQSAQLGRNNDGEGVLVVINAKNTNGRAHGTTRTIRLHEISKQDFKIVEEHLRNVESHKFSQNFADFYLGCRKLIFRISKQIWPRRLKRPALYTSRHKFGADAKSSTYDRYQIAALMGHASTETAYQHYGRRHTGSGNMSVKASQLDIDAVAKRNPEPRKSASKSLSP
jgi:hypothetical protein